MDPTGNNYKVDPLKTTVEGFGRNLEFWVDVLACLMSAYLRGAFTVGVFYVQGQPLRTDTISTTTGGKVLRAPNLTTTVKANPT